MDARACSLGLGWALYDGALIDFPQTKNKLGLPKGMFSKMSEEGKMVFTRQFEHGTLWVNFNTFEAEIKWSNGSKTSNRKSGR